MNILHSLNNKGKTIILVTHNNKIISNEKKVIRL